MKKTMYKTMVDYFHMKGVPIEIANEELTGVKSVYLSDIDITLRFTASGALMSASVGDWLT
jgi:hypothetical protein